MWGSGFELSASCAVPDASILPLGTRLEMLRAIEEARDAPVVAESDTGFGDAVNVAYAVPRSAAAGAAAVVMEDRTSPEDGSLCPGGRHAAATRQRPGKGHQGMIPCARRSRSSSSSTSPVSRLSHQPAWRARVRLETWS